VEGADSDGVTDEFKALFKERRVLSSGLGRPEGAVFFLLRFGRDVPGSVALRRGA
jgi:hypothetical protein